MAALEQTEEQAPFWCVNVPRQDWPAECPAFLQNLSAKDVQHLAVRDADYHWQTWAEVRHNVGKQLFLLRAGRCLPPCSRPPQPPVGWMPSSACRPSCAATAGTASTWSASTAPL